MECIKHWNMNIQMITLEENFHDQYFQSFVTLVLGKILDLNTQPYNEIEVTTPSKVIDSSVNVI